MTEHDFIIGPVDTDSISYCKSDMTTFKKEEITNLLKEINDISPEKMIWEFDGYFPCVIVFKAKNYVLYDGEKLKVKGSALKDAKKEQALKDFLKEIIWSIINEKNDYLDIYHKYIKEAMDIKDIKKWSSKKTLTEKVYSSERTQETKILDAVAGTEYREGDKIFVYFKNDKSLGLIESFHGDYDKNVMVKKLHNATDIFSAVIDTSKFLNYSLKRNKKALEELLK